MSLLRILPVFALTALVLAMVPGQGMAMVLRQTMTGGVAVRHGVGGRQLLGARRLGSGVVGGSQPSVRSLPHRPTTSSRSPARPTSPTCRCARLVSLRQTTGAFDTDGDRRRDPFAAYRLGLLTNLTNVKAAVFAVAFIPQLVPRGFAAGPGNRPPRPGPSPGVPGLVHEPRRDACDRAATALGRPSVRRALTAISAAGLLVLAIVVLVSSPR